MSMGRRWWIRTATFQGFRARTDGPLEQSRRSQPMKGLALFRRRRELELQLVVPQTLFLRTWDLRAKSDSMGTMWWRRARELFTGPSPAAAAAALLRQPRSPPGGLRLRGGEAALQTFPADLLRRLRHPCVEGSPSVAGAGRRKSPSWRPYCSAVSPDDGGAANAASAGCWNCGAAPPSSSSEAFLVCAACGSVQPVDSSVDFFKIFGL